MKKVGLLLCIIFIRVFAAGSFTTIESGVTLYSEYYPNFKASFKGTIIFENASGMTLDEWTGNAQFLKCANKYGSLFLYDHTGLGYSPPDLQVSGNNPITGLQVNNKLIKLLQANHIKPPYIVVSHSYGGLLAGYFVLKNPQLIKGLLMVDPVPKSYSYTQQLLDKFNPVINKAKEMPASYMYLNFGSINVEASYLLLGFDITKQQVASFGGINNNIPVIIVSSSELEANRAIQEDWYDSQKQWLNNNHKSKIFSIKSGHFIQLQHPQLVCDQIRDLVGYATDTSRK